MYELLPQEDRRAAEKRAKRLLRTTPAAPKREFVGTVRDALDTSFLKAENVVAALVYEAGNGTWQSDIVFRRGKHKFQRGVSCGSKQQALSCLKSQIAEIKATREHPLVADVRKMGIVDYDACLWLGVRHKQFGCRYVERYIDEIRLEGQEFLRKHGINESMGRAGMLYAERIAHDTVLLYAPEFATHDQLLLPPTGTDKSEDEIKLWQEAASFLLARGFLDIYDDVETDIIYERILRVPDKSLNIMWITGASAANEGSGALTPLVPNERKISAARPWPDNEAIVSKTRREYVADFQRCFKNWDASENCLDNCRGPFTLKPPSEKRIRSTLEMCRVVYEAQRSLSDWEFEDFCKEIRLTKRSAIRKFVAFGEAYPGVIQYMELFDPPQWFAIDLYLRWPSGIFLASDKFAEMWKTGVRDRLRDAGGRASTMPLGPTSAVA
jgi:hypothetical protein